MNVYEKLLIVQSELKAPKNQYNEFGKYNYRNAEDILEAVKPLCVKQKAVVYITDDLVSIGERYYVRATATFLDTEKMDAVNVTAFAREEESKKGMDGSQVTGAASSYARKYALNGLFAIDDTKDSDTTNTGDTGTAKPAKKPAPKANEKITMSDAVSVTPKTFAERVENARKEMEIKPTKAEKVKYFAAALGVKNSELKPIVEKYAPDYKLEAMSAVAFNSTLAEIEETAERNESKAV